MTYVLTHTCGLNHDGQGGAVCMRNGASATFTLCPFTSNSASSSVRAPRAKIATTCV